MSSNHDSDAFELRFEEATNDMHKRTDRGDTPSGNTWQSIRAQMGNSSQAETADPRANGPVHGVERSTSERNRTMDAALTPQAGAYTGTQRHRIGWMSALAAGMVGIMIFTSIWMNGGSPPPDDRNDLAWAPGMGTVESSPMSSPVANQLCTVEPLTEEEALSMVLNPNNGYNRLGGPKAAPESDTYYEGQIGIDLSTWTSTTYVHPEEPSTTNTLIALGTTVWDCYLYGTAYQVWALIDPIVVQQMILGVFPVVRTEDDIRNYISKNGPKQFSELNELEIVGLEPFFGDRGMHANPTGEGTFVIENIEEFKPLAKPVGLIELVPEREGDTPVYIWVIRVYPDVWAVYDITGSDPREWDAPQD